MATRPLRAVAYARLSREDLRGSETPEEKIEARAQMCRNLARQHGLPLAEGDIIREYGTGTSMADRPGLQRLLQLVEGGDVTHVVTPYQDRLTRGDERDGATIKETFCIGQVTLVSTEGVMPFDDEFGTRYELLFDVKRAFAAHFVRDVVKKRMEADLVKLKAGKLHKGGAPYGYRWLRPVRDAYNQLVTPGSYEVIPAEYIILEEIFRRLAIEKAPDIAADLNIRGAPPPATNRPGVGPGRWHASTLYAMIRNPFYAGRLSKRTRMARTKNGGKRKERLRPEDYVLSEVEGDWPHPITLEQHFAFISMIEGHKERAAPRGSLLTGIVFCAFGEPMVTLSHESYGCRCKEVGNLHAGRMVSGARLERWAQEIVTAVIGALPDDALPTPARFGRSRTSYQAELGRARRTLSDKQQQAQDVILREAYFVGLMGRAMYEQTARKTREEVEALSAQVEQLEVAAATPDTEEAVTLLRQLQRLGGMERFWQTATDAEKRGIVERIIRRIDVPVPTNRFCREASVTLWDWTHAYKPAIPPFPRQNRPGNVSNLLVGKRRRSDPPPTSG